MFAGAFSVFSVVMYRLKPEKVPAMSKKAARAGDDQNAFVWNIRQFFYMHYGQDVIAKADRFTRAFEDYRAEHCLLLG